MSSAVNRQAACVLVCVLAWNLSGCVSLDATTEALFPTNRKPQFSASQLSTEYRPERETGVALASATSPLEAKAGPDAETENPPPTFTVMLQPGSGKPTEVQLPLSGAAYVQTVLEQSGANREFRRMQIELWRPLAEGHHKLNIEYDRSTHRVPPAFDYALHPGDRLVVREDTSTVLDDIIGALPSPLSRAANR